ncbi:MAG: ATP-dependent helicase [Actinobacteria bacterium]|nr:ATP-dependent helicase [Actinomycetota bacterium]
MSSSVPQNEGTAAVAEPPTPDAVLDGLNDSQRAAASHLGGPLLIVAGAGSGKTRTLTKRFEWLVRSGVPAERILALTYTKDAAAELADRIEQALGEHVEETNATTFHSLCMNILRDEAQAAGLNPFFSTATGPDRVTLMLARMNELSFDRLALRGNPAQVIGEMLELIDRLKEECSGPDDLREYAEGALADAVEPDDRERAELLLEQARFYEQHELFLRDAAALDFGGMQFELWKLLSGNEEIRRAIARRFDHVLVDEFQDTSFVQLEILRLLTQDSRNIAAVGDDDQSIYRFRGASPRSIRDFGARFGEHRRIELELNYRSAPAIVNAARTVLAPIDDERRVPKELTAANAAKTGNVQFWRCAGEVAEAQAIVAEIERLIAEAGVQPRDICVLAATRPHLDVLLDRLSVHDIPHVLDSRDFFQRAEIRVPLSWLKVLANPTLNEDAWRMLTAAPVNLDSAEYAQLMRWMSKNKQPHVVAAMRSASRGKQFSVETLDKIRGFVEVYDAAAELLDELRPGEFVIRLINRISLKGSLLLRGEGDAPDRLANIGKLQRMAEEYGSRKPQATGREFALHISAMSEAGFEEPSEKAQLDPNAVRLMTAHGSKGLEFDYVFMPGMVNRRWPGSLRPDKFGVPEQLIREPALDPPGKNPARERHIEDQRRLAHVAMTRARTQLVLSWFEANSHGHKVSPFYAEALELTGGDELEFEERAFDTGEFVFAELARLRGELLRGVDQTGAQLGEMRLDAGADTPAEFARFAELIKLSALTHRLRQGQTIAAALPDVNALLTSTMSPPQRSEFENSALDQRLLGSERHAADLRGAISATAPQLGNFVPTVGENLRLSASDIGTYQRCPKMYEYEKVLRIPTREQSHLRLGILVHNVLERYHRDLGDRELSDQERAATIEALFEKAVATGGWGSSDDDRQLLDRARAMLARYAGGELAQPAGSTETEVKFSLKLPPTEAMASTPVGGRLLSGIQINGKIDRIDRAADTTRLIDYKTGKKKSVGEVQKDLQLALYRLAASEVLGIDASQLIYYFLEADSPAVEADAGEERVAEVRETINEVADRIVRLEFEPTPSFQICKNCAFNHVCPATEA